jgi:hypothetical protein
MHNILYSLDNVSNIYSKVSEPYANPFWERVTQGEERGKNDIDSAQWTLSSATAHASRSDQCKIPLFMRQYTSI